MEDKKYQREEGRNDAERAYLPKGNLESIFSSEDFRKLNYRGKEYGR